jgi:hypothetical protein
MFFAQLPGTADKGAKHDGSFSTTSTIPSTLGLHAASPLHITGREEGSSGRLPVTSAADTDAPAGKTFTCCTAM